MTSRERDRIRAQYEARHPVLKQLAASLETEVKACLDGLPHIDRVSFRAKDIPSFVEKAMKEEGDGLKYKHPLEEIEDQVAGRVLVFYRPDIEAVVQKLCDHLGKVELEHRAAEKENEFGYETRHAVFVIPNTLRPAGWEQIEDPPTTFEMQVRTLAQHAWSEPQHEFYKHGGFSKEATRRLYWAAGLAWGIDTVWEDLANELARLEKHPN